MATREEIRRHIRDLLSEDLSARALSIEELPKFGEEAAQEIVSTLMRKTSQPHAMESLTDALEQIGKPSAHALLDALDQIPEVTKPADAYLLENLVETLGRLQDRHAAGALSLQLEKLNRAIERNHNLVLVDICEAAKVRIHSTLSDWNDRSAVDDLQKMLGDGRSRVRDGVVAAVGKIGDRRALLPLLRLHDVEEPVSQAGAAAIRQAFRDIVRREGIGESDPIFAELPEGERAELDKLFPKTKNGNGKP